ncbi:MAG TPA: NrfD/PsrC family molybdoenzyme membrane anchor subunit [Anaeromyxobacteraceae bacterium]|nr:NrfD/PsrC family molybdoenzyme membrane anchor subunit [Anaeromyxobacteraceae bacterium]
MIPTDEETEGPSYHGLPVLKRPVWTWEVPAYFTVGGLAGSCAVLGASAALMGGRGARLLVRRCRLVAAGGAIASAGLLVSDLGRPERFLFMLRVFRPTSPLNMGTWVLSGFGALSGLAALPEVVRTPPAVRRAAEVAGFGAGVLGLPLVGYTGVLLANTAVPVWQATKNTLPILFAFSGAVTAGALLHAWMPEGVGAEMAHRFGLLARGAELSLSEALHREAARDAPRVARPLTQGGSGALIKAARILNVASAVLDLFAYRHRRARIASAALALAGTVALRYGIVAAGRASAADPHATFDQQRAGHGAADLVKHEERPDRMPSPLGVDATGQETSVDAPR